MLFITIFSNFKPFHSNNVVYLYPNLVCLLWLNLCTNKHPQGIILTPTGHILDLTNLATQQNHVILQQCNIVHACISACKPCFFKGNYKPTSKDIIIERRGKEYESLCS